jgi:hypothetical protein
MPRPGGHVDAIDTEERQAPFTSILSRYLAGWADAAPQEIIAAAADDYVFHDPLVGTFSRGSLPCYFQVLAESFVAYGALKATDLAFVLHSCGPPPRGEGKHRLWREASRLGLFGETSLVIGRRGVVSENVNYDLNLASHAPPRPGPHLVIATSSTV